MAIHRVGKGPVAPTHLPEVDGANPTSAAGAVERPFDVRGAVTAEASKTAASKPAAAVAGASPLERLRAGEIDLPRYLDLKVDQATAHLRGLPRVELHALKETLRERLATDPALVDLVKQATGAEPAAPEE